MRRFIQLIDALYYNQRNVIIDAHKPLEELFFVDNCTTHGKLQFHDEEFAFSRCLSRLKEMQTINYQEKTLLKDKQVVCDMH